VGLEIGVEVEPDADRHTARAAIAGYGAALELVDLGAPPDNPEEVVAANVFHRAFSLGLLDRAWPSNGVEGRLIVNGELRAAAAAPCDYVELVLAVARLLGAVGQRLQVGDRMIMGSIVQVPIAAGDDVIADLGALGQVGLAIAR
jgi:2-keto-4-pentenoate hydratase